MVSSVEAINSLYAGSVTEGSKVRPAVQAQANTRTDSLKRLAIQDTVKLSTSAQILAMKQTGATVTQIAAKLNLSVTEVDTELDITSTASSQASTLAALSAKQ